MNLLENASLSELRDIYESFLVPFESLRCEASRQPFGANRNKRRQSASSANIGAEWKATEWQGLFFCYSRRDVEAAFLEYYLQHRLAPMFFVTLGAAVTLNSLLVFVSNDISVVSTYVRSIDIVTIITELSSMLAIVIIWRMTEAHANQRDLQFSSANGGSSPPSGSPASVLPPEQNMSWSHRGGGASSLRFHPLAPHSLTRRGRVNTGSTTRVSEQATESIFFLCRLHEVIVFVSFFVWVFVPTFGSAQRSVCHEIPVEKRYVACSNSVLVDAFALISITLSVFFMKMRIAFFGFAMAAMVVATVVAHRLPSYLSIVQLTDGAFWGVTSATFVEAVLCVVTMFRNEKNARDHFEVFVEKQLKSAELMTVRKQTEAMVSAQVPLAVVKRWGTLNDSDGMWGFHHQLVVCCIAMEGFASWSSRRSPMDAVELLQVVLASLDSVRSRSLSAPVKYHSFGDLYVLSLAPESIVHNVIRATCCDMLVVCVNAVLVADEAVARCAASWGHGNAMLIKGNEVECDRTLDILHMSGGLDVGPGCGVTVRHAKNVVLVGRAAETCQALASKFGLRRSGRRLLTISEQFAGYTIPHVPITGGSTLMVAQSLMLGVDSSLCLKEPLTLPSHADRKFDVLVVEPNLVHQLCASGLGGLQLDPTTLARSAEGFEKRSCGPSLESSKKKSPGGNSDDLDRQTSATEASDIQHARDVSAPLDRLVLEYYFLVFPKFRGDDMEAEFLSIQGNEEEGGASTELWVFLVEVCAHSIFMAVYSCLVSDFSLGGSAFSLLTVLLAATMVLFSMCSSLKGKWERAAFTGLYLLFVASYVACSLLSIDGNFIKYSSPLICLMLCGQATKFPLWYGPVKLCLVEATVCWLFFVDERWGRGIYNQISPFMSKFFIVMFLGVPVVMFLCRVRWSANLREEFAVRRSIALLEQQLRSDYEKLEEVLKHFAPGGFAKGFIAYVREKAAAQNRQANPTVVVRPDASTNITTASDDVPFVMVKIRLRHTSIPTPTVSAPSSDSSQSSECHLRYSGGTTTFASNTENEMRAAVAALQEYVERLCQALTFKAPDGSPRRSVEVVKASLETIVAAVAIEPSASLEDQLEVRCWEVLLAASRVWGALHRLRSVVDFKLIIGCGQSIGGVLGSDCVSFEYYGGKIGFAQELLHELPWGSAVVHSKFVRTVVQVLPLDGRSRSVIDVDNPLWSGFLALPEPTVTCNRHSSPTPPVTPAATSWVRLSHATPMLLNGFARQDFRFISFSAATPSQLEMHQHT